MTFCNRFCKAAQRTLLSTLINQSSATIRFFAAIGALALCLTAASLLWALVRPASPRGHLLSHADNIGGRSFEDVVGGAPIDAVITWVNGSDPEWFSLKTRTKRLVSGLPLNCQPSNSTSSECEQETSGDGANRYRDNDELRYNFRSLEKFAPWLRRIHLVTNGQVPNWLDISHPRVRVVTHADIFPDPAHLPVFSSPAIEVHLHRIPGLSRRFIYLNDDVMLGSDISPDDFYSHTKGTKVYLSWEVPKCNNGCQDTWLGDGACDLTCNTTRCLYDGGDCINASIAVKYASNSYSGSKGSSRYTPTTGSASTSPPADTPSPPEDLPCVPGCPSTWLGDLMCDAKCDSAECGWDGADCGIEKVWRSLPGASASDAVRVANGNATDAASGFEPDELWDDIIDAVLSKTREIHDALVLGHSISLGTAFLACDEIAANASSWLPEILRRALSARPLVSLPLSLDTTVSSAYVNLTAALRTAHARTGADLAILSAALQSDFMRNGVRAACQEIFVRPACVEGLGNSVLNASSMVAIGSNISNSSLKINTSSLLPGRGTTVDGAVNLSAMLECQQHARTAIALAWNSSAFAEIVRDRVATSRSVRTINGAEYVSYAGVKSAVFSAHYDVLIVMFNGEALDERAPTVSASSLVSMLPSPSAAPIPSPFAHLQVPAVNMSNRSAAVNGSLPSVADVLRPTSTDANASWRTAVLRLAPLSAIEQVMFSLSFGVELRCSNVSINCVDISVTRHLLFNASLKRPARVDFTQLAVNFSNVSAFSAANFSQNTTRYDQVVGNHTFNVDGASSPVLSRRLHAASATVALQTSAQRLPPQKPTMHHRVLNVIRRARAEADAAINSAQERKHWQTLVSNAWAAVKVAASATAASPDLRLWDTYSEFADMNQAEESAHMTSSSSETSSSSVLSLWVLLTQYAISLFGSRPGSENATRDIVTASMRRLGEDTYADSLVHTTRLIASKFGRKSSRRVPAHMPHMIDSVIMNKLQSTFFEQFEATSSHKFRSSDDVQFATAYFFFVMDGGAREGIDLATYFARELDTDNDGFLSENELRTLALLVFRHSPKADELETLRDCIAPPTTDVKVVERVYNDGSRESTTEKSLRRPGLTAVRLSTCSLAMDALSRYARMPPTHEDMNLDEVGFEMITDDINKTLEKLDSLRMRKPKFLCVNDDMELAPLGVQQVLQNFYQSLFPLPSQFELPAGRVNPYLYLDKLRAHLGLPVDPHTPPPWFPSDTDDEYFAGFFHLRDSSTWLVFYGIGGPVVVLSLFSILYLLWSNLSQAGNSRPSRGDGTTLTAGDASLVITGKTDARKKKRAGAGGRS